MGAACGGLLRPRRASQPQQWRCRWRRSGLSSQPVRGGTRGAVLKEGRTHFLNQPLHVGVPRVHAVDAVSAHLAGGRGERLEGVVQAVLPHAAHLAGAGRRERGGGRRNGVAKEAGGGGRSSKERWWGSEERWWGSAPSPLRSPPRPPHEPRRPGSTCTRCPRPSGAAAPRRSRLAVDWEEPSPLERPGTSLGAAEGRLGGEWERPEPLKPAARCMGRCAQRGRRHLLSLAVALCATTVAELIYR